MAFARDSFTASAAQTDFTISFNYQAETDVLVYEDGVLKTQGAGNDYIFSDSTTIRFNAGLVGGETIVLQRSTSQSTRTVDYTPGPLAEADLDNDSIQAYYMAQEAIDIANTAMGLDTDDLWTAQSKRLKNVDTPTAGNDAVNKTYADALVLGVLGTPLGIENGGTGGATAAAAKAALDLEIGTDLQAWDAGLDDIAALSPTDSNFIVGDGTNWVLEPAATALISLGLTTASRIKTAQRLALYNLAV